MSENRKRLFCYIGITFVISWGLLFAIPLTGHIYGDGFSTLLLAGIMFVPTIGNILTRLFTREGFQDFKLAPHFKGNGKWYLFSYVIITVLIFLGAGLYFVIFPGQLDIHATSVMESMQAAGTSFSLGGYLLICILISPIVNILPTLGEELGWRGYLLFKLQEDTGTLKAVLLTGFIWGIWHAPMIAMGHNYGKDYPGYPVVGILLMILWCMVLGVIEGYVTIKIQSAVPAAICHSAVNGLAAIGLIFCNTAPNPLLGPLICGLIPMLPALLLACYLVYRMKKTKLA